jgi:hypothetical protein
MKVYFNITYKDGSTKQVRVRRTQNWEALQVALEHYRSMSSIEDVYIDVR